MNALGRKPKAVPQKPALTKVGQYFVHPYKAFVPEMGEPMFRAHVEKISRNKGQSHPITLDEDDLLLDGRADVRACEELGFELLPAKIHEGDAAQFVLDNMIRTRYSKAQCAVVAARLLRALDDEKTEAKRLGQKKSKLFTGRAADFVGRLAGEVSAPLVYQARRMLDTHDGIIAVIDSGHIEHFAHAVELSKWEGPKLRRALKRIVVDKKDPASVLDRSTKLDDEWYTPEYILQAVRFAFDGEIDCDPCSPTKKTAVRAKTTWTKKENGLKQEWPGNVFVNPPFSEPEKWIDRAIEVAEQKPPGVGVYMLLPVRPDMKHQAKVLKASFDVLLLEGRPAFQKEIGTPRSGTGLRSLMIVGLNVSTRRIADGGLPGLIVVSGEERSLKEDYIGMHSAGVATLVAEGRFAELERSAAPDGPEEEAALHALIATVNAEQNVQSAASRAKVATLKAQKAPKKKR